MKWKQRLQEWAILAIFTCGALSIGSKLTGCQSVGSPEDAERIVSEQPTDEQEQGVALVRAMDEAAAALEADPENPELAQAHADAVAAFQEFYDDLMVQKGTAAGTMVGEWIGALSPVPLPPGVPDAFGGLLLGKLAVAGSNKRGRQLMAAAYRKLGKNVPLNDGTEAADLREAIRLLWAAFGGGHSTPESAKVAEEKIVKKNPVAPAA